MGLLDSLKNSKLTLKAVKYGSVGSSVVVAGKLTRCMGLVAIPNATVAITVTPPSGSPTSVNKVTDANGQFSVNVPLTIQGAWTVKADYAGEPNKYKPSSASVSITALPAPVPTTLVLTGATEGTVGDTIVISGCLQT